ncbi:MAG: NTPase [Theionarchaea archaeon]|nr:NTPase [Theionarchaea archaeon]MBU7037276.1 NTPase [Theionarchaea archaeon]
MNILITGHPGVGKTTLIKKVFKDIDTKSGFFTGEMREKGRRVGFAIETVDGIKGVLAHVDSQGKYRVSKYKVNISDIETICVPSLNTKSDLIVIDEIGKMELFSDKFRECVLRALDTGKVVATIMEQSHPFADAVKNRDDVELVTVTEETRDELVSILREKVKRNLV